MRSPDPTDDKTLQAEQPISPADPTYKEDGIDQMDVGGGPTPPPPIDSGGPRQ